MSLLCADINSEIIKLIVRWHSDEMLQYLYVQAEPIMNNFLDLTVRLRVYNLMQSATNEVLCYELLLFSFLTNPASCLSHPCAHGAWCS